MGILLLTLKSRIKRRLAAVDIVADSGGYVTGGKWQVAGQWCMTVGLSLICVGDPEVVVGGLVDALKREV